MELPNLIDFGPKLQTIALRSERTIEGEEALICIRKCVRGMTGTHTHVFRNAFDAFPVPAATDL
jgi:hypothetical protein